MSSSDNNVGKLSLMFVLLGFPDESKKVFTNVMAPPLQEHVVTMWLRILNSWKRSAELLH